MTVTAKRWQRMRVVLFAPRSALLMVVFCVLTGIGMVWSILTVFATTLGASTVEIGAMFSMFGGARVLASFPSGVASERFGRRPLMVSGLLFLTVSSFAAIDVTSPPMLILFLVAQGLGEGMYLTTAMAAVADLSTPERRVRDMAAYQGVALAGMSIGPGLGGLTAAAWGFGAPFLLQGILGVLAMAAMVGLVPNKKHGEQSASSRPMSNARPRIASMLGLACMTFGVYFTRIAANWVLMPLIVRDALGMGVEEIGALYTIGAIANLLALPAADFAARRLGRLPVMVAASAVMLTALVLLADVGTAAGAGLATALMGISTGFAAPLLSAYAIDAAPPGGLGAATGLLRSVMDIAFITAPAVVGGIVDQLGMGYAAGLWFAGLLLVLSTMVFCLSPPRADPIAKPAT